jgi:hypothetical protein
MTDRHTVDSITSDALDQLYYRLDQIWDAAALHRQGLLTAAELYAVIEADDPLDPATTGHVYLSTGCHHGDHAYCQAMTGLNGAKRPSRCKFCDARCQCSCHDEQPSGPAAIEAIEAARAEVVRQMDADPDGLKAGMIVKPYTEHGEKKWVFRCWGTDDGCDGWLSLDHYSQQSAQRARDRHVAEEHQAEATEPVQQTDADPDDPPVQCWHTEPDTPCDWDVCKQPERLAVGDYGTDPREQPGA